MKRFVLILLVILGWHQTWAQSHETVKTIEIGATSRIGAFNITQKFVPVPLEQCIEGCSLTRSRPSLNLSLGVEVRFELSGRLRISSGILYASSTYHEKYIGNDGANNFSSLTKRSFDFINIPLLLNGTFYSFYQDAFSLFGEAGVINQFNLTSDFPDKGSSITLRRHGISGLIATGIRFTKEQYLFELSPYFMHSFTSFGKDAAQDTFGPHKFVPYSIGFNISVLYSL